MSNVPELRFSEFASTGSAQVLGEWEEKTLGEIGSFKNGFNADKTAFGSGTEFVNLMDIFGKIEIKKIQLNRVEINEKQLEHYKIKKGDVLFVRSSVKRTGVGQSCLVNDNFVDTVYSGFIIRFRQKSNELYHQYQKYCFSTIPFRKKLLSLATSSANTNINQESLVKIILAYPDKTEQQKIATFLSAVDKKLGHLRRKHTLLERYKRGVMQRLIDNGKLKVENEVPAFRFKDEQGNDYPDWEEKRLGDVFAIGSGRDYKHLGSGDIPVYGTGGFMLNVNEYLYDGESACIGRKGTIDKPVFLTGKFWTVDTLFYTHSFNNVLPKFIYYCFQLINWKKFNEASGVPSLSKSTIESIQIVFPSLEEQQKIANFLSTLDKKLEAVQKQIDQTELFKKGLLQKMFV